MKVNTTIEITGIHEVFDLTGVLCLTSGGVEKGKVAATNCGYFLIDEFFLDEKKGVYNNGGHAFEGKDFLFTEKSSIEEAVRIGNSMIIGEVLSLKKKIGFLEAKDLNAMWEHNNPNDCSPIFPSEEVKKNGISGEENNLISFKKKNY